MMDLCASLSRNKRSLSPSLDELPQPKRHDLCHDDVSGELSFSLDSPMSSPQRTCTLSPNFLDDVADELELGELLLPERSVESVEPPVVVPNRSRGSTRSTPDPLQTLNKEASLPPISLLEAVQPAYIISRSRSQTDLSCGQPERPSSPEASMLQSHTSWQKKLKSSLQDCDAATRALLSPATGRDLYGTVQVLARLSPRQIDALHPPARELVTSLLDQTREQVCQDAGLPPAGMWEMPSLSLSRHPSMTNLGQL